MPANNRNESPSKGTFVTTFRAQNLSLLLRLQMGALPTFALFFRSQIDIDRANQVSRFSFHILQVTP